MATFVLVHPACGWCWKKVATILRARGNEVFAPTLTRLGERAHLANREVGLGTHIDDVASILKFEDIRDAILVGNSSGGMVITGVADRMPERIAHVVYLDETVSVDALTTGYLALSFHVGNDVIDCRHCNIEFAIDQVGKLKN